MSISDAMNLRRIYFYAGRGIAQNVWDRPAVELKTPPDLGFPFVDVDYEPSLQCYQVRPTAADKIRDMTADERKACSAYLAKL